MKETSEPSREPYRHWENSASQLRKDLKTLEPWGSKITSSSDMRSIKSSQKEIELILIQTQFDWQAVAS